MVHALEFLYVMAYHWFIYFLIVPLSIKAKDALGTECVQFTYFKSLLAKHRLHLIEMFFM